MLWLHVGGRFVNDVTVAPGNPYRGKWSGLTPACGRDAPFRRARDVIIARLLEVLLIEALRPAAGPAVPPGLVRRLADERVGVAIRRMHESPTGPWTVARLAKEAALSRSAFFDRFSRVVGVAPMAYLLAWRMALAKTMLKKNRSGIAEIAGRVGHRAASAFSVAFTRHVGLSPTRYAHEHPE